MKKKTKKKRKLKKGLIKKFIIFIFILILGISCILGGIYWVNLNKEDIIQVFTKYNYKVYKTTSDKIEILDDNYIIEKDNTGVIEKITLPAPKLEQNNLLSPNKLTYEIKATYLDNDIHKVYKVNIYENIYVVQNISIVPSLNMEMGGI